MKRTLQALILLSLPVAAVIGWGTLFSNRTFAQQTTPQGISDSVLEQIAAIEAIKQSLTPAQQKISSNLVFATKAYNGGLVSPSGVDISSAVDATVDGTVSSLNSSVAVDIYGNVTPALLDAIAAANGVVTAQSEQFGIVTASLPISALETLAASPDVKNIQAAAQGVLNAGALTSQGYISHRANQAVLGGITGSGVTVGVLSDSASLARVAALIASGDLPANTQVLPGQQSSGTDEGAAMMEIVHDIAPGANLLFATANGGPANFANNIVALRAAGAQVIVDDITYFNEGAFQDGPIAQAVTQVTANGAIYFSSAANSGNLTSGTSGTWEGDFLSGGPITGPIAIAGESGLVHNFGNVALPQTFNGLTGATTRISLKWSDPLGASTNDYDIFLLNSTGTALKAFSAAVQNGTQDPYEIFVSQAGTTFLPGDRIVVVLFAGQTRALRVDTHRGVLSIATAGSTFGHNAGGNTVTMAATFWNSAKTGTKPFVGATNPIERFSSDGPRKLFFNPNGTQITPGNLLFATNGGMTLQKPDLTAADGGSAKTPGFSAFFGTSAAAPHAAGIAALVLQVRPAWTPAQVLNAMRITALDNMAAGTDRDGGAGIAMAYQAVQYALTH